jgi:hypothetical protein
VTARTMTADELRAIVREQLEWCQVFHQLAPGANVQEAFSSGQVAVYVTAGTPPSRHAPPPHRLLHVVSPESVDEGEYAAMLKDASASWNQLSHDEKLAATEARVGNKWNKEKLLRRLADKGFHVAN